MKEKLRSLMEKRENIVTQQKALLDKAEAEKREFTAEETAQYEAMDKDFEQLTTDIATVEGEIRKHNERRAAIADREHNLSSARGTQVEIPGGRGVINVAPPTPQTPDAEFRLQAFNKYLARGERTQFTDAEARAVQADKDAIGGFLVAPELFIERLIQNITDEVYIRQISTVFPVLKAESIAVPTIEADMGDATWTSEIKTGSADSTLQFGKRSLFPHPVARRILASKTLLRVSVMSIDQIIRNQFQKKFGMVQENGFMTGTGVNQPLGVFTASADGIPTSRDVSTGNTNTLIKADGLIEALYHLKQPYWRNARWIFHRDAVKQIRKLKDGEGNYLWQSGLASNKPATILDIPYIMSEYAPNTFTTGLYVGIVGDFSNYWIVDALSMQVQVLSELYAETNQNAYIGRLECDGAPVLSEAFIRVTLA